MTTKGEGGQKYPKIWPRGLWMTLKGEEGNIAINHDTSNAALFSGYVDDFERTKKAFLNNLYLTGDRGYIDKDGYIWFTSRQDDVIISAGYRIGRYLI